MRNTLPFGKFYGTAEMRLDTAPFTFVQLTGIGSKPTPVHTHETAHFVFIIDGFYEAKIKSKRSSFSSSTLLFHPAGITHDDHVKSEVAHLLTVSLGQGIEGRLFDGLKPIDHSSDFSGVESSWLAMKIRRELFLADGLSEIVLEGLANELLVHAVRDIEKSEKPPRWLDTVHELINDRCNEKITVSEIADTAGLTAIHLARAFRKFYDCSPGEYLRVCRANHAANLLSTSKNSLAEVGLLSGYSDQSDFCRSFKRVFGMTPKKYRDSGSSPLVGN